MKLTRTSFELVENIFPQTRDEMYRLFEAYYTGVTKEAFLSDLAAKELVLMVRATDTQALIGFTTIVTYDINDQDGKIATAVFSGDTVMDKMFWGTKIFQWEFTRYLLRLKISSPTRRLYWMLMSKGFKTYLMVRRNCPRTFPSFDLKDDSDLRFVRDTFYSRRYPKEFDSKAGVVRFATPKGAIAPKFAQVSQAAMADPDVTYFLENNPDYGSGTELACVAEVRLRDFPVALAKYVGKVAARIVTGNFRLEKVD